MNRAGEEHDDDMDTKTQKAFDFASDAVKQLVTLSSAIIAFTVTFLHDLVGVGATSTSGLSVPGLVVASWVMYGISILFGAWTGFRLTGQLTTSTPSIEAGGVTLWTGVCVVAFILGTGCLVAYGISLA
jgi:hypothetical protein